MYTKICFSFSHQTKGMTTTGKMNNWSVYRPITFTQMIEPRRIVLSNATRKFGSMLCRSANIPRKKQAIPVTLLAELTIFFKMQK